MKFLQKLGKALMLPVAVLPICGILMGIGYYLCPATMQGGEVEGIKNLIGFFLVKAGSALIENMAILFAIGVGVGMSEKNDGTGGIAALASWLMITTLLSTGVVTTLIPSIADNATKTLAFNKIANPFIGILSGVIGSSCYNKFKNTKLPNWLAFFSGKRCVAIIAGLVSIVVSAVLLFVWPLLFSALVALGDAVAGMDVVLYTDYQSQTIKDTKGNVSPLKGLPKSNVLKYNLSDEKTYFIVRPSGTEPKIKLYLGTFAESFETAEKTIEKVLEDCKKQLEL